MSPRRRMNALAAHAALLPMWLWSCAGRPPQPTTAPAPAQATGSVGADDLVDLAAADASEWVDPPELAADATGVHRIVVTMARRTIRLAGKDYPVHLRTYNGELTGPTIRFRAGELLKVTLENKLPPERNPAECGHGNTPACFNVTNLHTHGLHVSPSGKADDVFVQVMPEGRRDYEYPVHPDHYPGTFWYHAHRHGSTAVQLASGMSGALILLGDLDAFPGVKEARERIFIFQQLAWDGAGELKAFDHLLANWEGGVHGGRDAGPPKHTTINGQVKPRISMRPGEVERWRLIDAGVFEMLDVELLDERGVRQDVFRQIAIDGITRKTVARLGTVQLGPGYRTDLLVKAPMKPGRYTLRKLPSSVKLAAGDLDLPGVDNRQDLAVLDVEGVCAAPDCFSRWLAVGSPLPWPRTMLPDIDAREVTGRRAVEFSADRTASPPKFLINGRQHDHHRIDHDLELGAIEEWTLTNTDPGARGAGQAHPFHIHVNAFQVLDAQGRPGEWRDTIIVPYNRRIRVRSRYERFTGTFVLHCHILTHEDLGMMQSVRISGPARDTVDGAHDAHAPRAP